MIKNIRDIEKTIMYEPGPRRLFDGENAKRISLRK
jgi:hypothetical protein